MKTLLQIDVCCNWGSTGKIAEQIGLLAEKQGWTVYLVWGRHKNPSKLTDIRVGNMLGVYEHYAENILLDNEGLASRCATKKLIKKIEKIKPDVVQLHDIHNHWLNYKILFEYLVEKQIPVVWTQHDQWATTGHCCYNLVGCDRWKTECYDCPLSKWYSLDRSRRNFNLKKNLCAGLKSLTIVPVSEWLADNMRQSHLKDRPIEVIHNGIDINVFRPQTMDVHKRYGIDEGKKIVLGVAAVWDARKGLTDFYQLAKRLPADEYSIVIVGKLTEEKQAVEGGCQMVFVDRTQNTLELAQLYSAASVFANPTYQDNYPTTNLEAIACGTPVITYNTGGSPEAVDENTGAVVAQGDVEALATAIEKFSAMDCKEACLKRAEALFDNKKCFNAYILLYNKLLGGGKIILAVASVWSDAKGLSDYIKLSEVLPDDYIIVLVGLTESQIASLPQRIVGLPRTQNVTDLVQLYSMAHIVMSLSYSETFGLSIVEGMACGTPAIVYNNTAQRYLIDERTGLTVETGDIARVAEAVKVLDAKIEANAEGISADCRKRAREYYDKNKNYQSYISLYNKLLGGGRIMLLGVAAPWSERKGLQDYIALSKILPPEYVIVLIGLDKEQIELLPDNMVGIGRTQNQAELAAYYSMADILLSLSTGETFGMTMAEAYGCGTPVIVYDNTAQPEIVTPETGRVVKTGDIEALAATIREFRDTDFKKHHTSACRKRAEECFNKDKCFEKYIELYEQILTNK